MSGGKVQRPGLERVHDALRSGDVLAVWRLDRLGRSLKHLIELMAELEAERIGSQSVTESIDTTTRVASWCFTSSGRSLSRAKPHPRTHVRGASSRESTRQERRQAKKAW